MFDIIKKSLYAGIGALALTEEKMQEVVDEFVDKGKLTQKEGETLVEELQDVIQENKTKLSKMIDERVKDLLDELDVAMKKDVADLEKQMQKDVTKLEKRVAALEKQVKADKK
jgi:polyhydroxyalkanoate synthesis regulator phasin